MKFEIDPGDSPERPSMRPPPDFLSWKFRLRLGSLLVALLVVIILMKEARKPGNWEWMGFDQPDATSTSNSNDETNLKDRREEDALDAKSERGSITFRRIELGQGELGPAEHRPYPELAVQFWENFISQYPQPEYLLRLFEMTEAARQQQVLDPRLADQYQLLLQLLSLKRKQFHNEQFDRTSFMEDSELKEKLTGQLFESRQFWDQKIRPGFSGLLNGEELTLSQVQAIEQLQTVIDPFAYRLVADEAPLNRNAEAAATLRIRELTRNSKSPPIPVQQIQLSGQPGAYRGKRILVRGWLRRLETKTLPGNVNARRYIGWLRPADSNLMPYCIYLDTVPADYQEQLEKVPSIELNEHVEIVGFFFKIRSYESAEKKLLTCPLIFARHFQQVALPGAETSIDELWRPSWGVWIGFFIGMPIVATLIAMAVFRGTSSRQRRPGDRKASQIKDTLDGLADDPHIQTDAEQVKEFAEQMQRESD